VESPKAKEVCQPTELHAAGLRYLAAGSEKAERCKSRTTNRGKPLGPTRWHSRSRSLKTGFNSPSEEVQKDYTVVSGEWTVGRIHERRRSFPMTCAGSGRRTATTSRRG
jgi:hypothetical protein